MNSFLLPHLCLTWLVPLSRIVCEMEGRWLYNCYFMGMLLPRFVQNSMQVSCILFNLFFCLKLVIPHPHPNRSSLRSKLISCFTKNSQYTYLPLTWKVTQIWNHLWRIFFLIWNVGINPVITSDSILFECLWQTFFLIWNRISQHRLLLFNFGKKNDIQTIYTLTLCSP